MKKAKLNYIVDFLALISFVITAVSGVALKAMPGGVRQGGLQEFFGIQKTVWVEIHDRAGMLMIILVLIHLFLHWSWIVCVTKNMFQTDKCEIKADDIK